MFKLLRVRILLAVAAIVLAMGAAWQSLHTSEGIVGALYTQIQAGLLQAAAFDRDALMFFEVHIHVDDGHADKLESILLPMLRTPLDELRVERAIRVALDARCRFFDGVLREADALGCQ